MNNIEEDTKLKERAFKICQEFLGGLWNDILLGDVQFDVIRGGMSNKLYRCALPKNIGHNIKTNDDGMVPKEALIRIYGPIESGQDSRLREMTVFSLLSERKLGPKLYGLFAAGRLEEYIPSRSMCGKDLHIRSTAIAKEMAKIHALKLPIRKTPLFPTQAYTWLKFVEENIDRNSTNALHRIIFNGEYVKEVEWVINQIEKVNPPIVFCHNDLQEGNILLLDSPRSENRNVMLIDFEYSAYNYRGFDLANHFNARCLEFIKVDSELSYKLHLEKYPTKSEQLEFIDAYLSQLQKEGISFKNDFGTEKNKMLDEIVIMRLAVILYWIVAACNFDRVSAYNFPYLKIGEEWWGMYKTHKMEFLQDSSKMSKEKLVDQIFN